MSSTRGFAKILVILGPTASGKSDLAVKIAKKFGGEIISADSRQVYKGLDIGSGKVPRDKISKSKFLISKQIPSTKSQKKLPYFYKDIEHHLLDIASPKKTFTVAQYQKLARAALKKILLKGKLPIVVGGTGFYIDSLLSRKKFPAVKPNPKLRRNLEKKSTEELYAKLKKLDPRRAKTIDYRNKRRLVRALEIIIQTGKPIPPLDTNSRNMNVLKIGIAVPPEELKKRIKKRLLARLKQGMVKEVKKLNQEGLSWKRLDDLGLEYRYASRYLRGLIYPSADAQGRSRSSKEIMIELLERETWRYAKRQMTWWRRDKEIRWLQSKKTIFQEVRNFFNCGRK